MGESRAGRARLNPDRAAGWSRLHHGVDPRGIVLLGPWLTVMWTLARPLVRLRVPPTAVTVAGGALAALAIVLARPWPLVAAAAVPAAALCDGLDGAVAVIAERASRSGALADAVADRVADIAFALVLWRCGAPLWCALLAALLAVAVDTVRRLVRRPAAITVAERPSWTICAVLACVTSAVGSARWPVLVCAAVWIVLGVVGLVQLVASRAVRAVDGRAS